MTKDFDNPRPSVSFDPTKPVQTRDGRAARILCTDANGPLPIIALVKATNGNEEVMRLLADGQRRGRKAWRPDRDDLVNIPMKRRGWTNVYRNQESANGVSIGPVICDSKEDARLIAKEVPLATIEIEWEE